MLHRDIKPANVLVDERGAPRLTDFGVARVSDAERLTRTGQAFGTPHYMPLEQLDGKEVDERADVYALGAILYELLAGALPWDAPSLVALIHAKQQAPPPPSRLRREVPASADAVCLRALAPDAADRYPSARALADDLERLLAGGVVRAPQRRRRRVMAALGVAPVVAALLVALRPHERGGATPAEVARLRADLEARAAASRSLATVEVDREAALAALADPAGAASRDGQVLRAWLGLLDLARGDGRAAEAAVAALDTAVMDELPARALRGGLAARAGDPRAAVDDLEAASRAGLRQPEVEAWQVIAMARRGLDRGDAAAWLRRLPALRARADVRAPAADLLEVACLLGVEQRLAAEEALARLEAPPAELRWDLATLAAAELVRKGDLAAALGGLARASRPGGPARPQEATLVRALHERLDSLARERERAQRGLEPAEVEQVIAGLALWRGTGLPVDAALGPPFVGIAERTVLLGEGGIELPLFLAVAEAWPDDATVQPRIAAGLLNLRFVGRSYLEPVGVALEERLAAAGARGARLVTGQPSALAGHLLQLSALVNLGRFSAADRVGDVVEALYASLPSREVGGPMELRFDALLLRARAAGGCGRLPDALALIDAAEQDADGDPLASRLVRCRVLTDAGRSAEALEVLLELSASPPRRAATPVGLLADAAWDALGAAGRWADLRRLHDAVKEHVSGERVWYRLAWLCARDGDLDAAADALDRLAIRYGVAVSAPAVRRGDPEALRALEAQARREVR